MILLTGATGFIGRSVLEIKSNRFRIFTRTDLLDIPSEFLENNEVYKFSSLNAEEKYEGAFRNIDSVIHLAGLAHFNNNDVSQLYDINTHSTLNLARQAAESGVKRFVFVSSVIVHGKLTPNHPFSYEDQILCSEHYPMSKYNAEIGLRKIANETSMEVVIVRPTLVYGRGAPGNFGLLENVVKKTPFLPFLLVSNKKDFISVQNLSDLLVTCATHPKAGGNVFLASDMESVSIKEFTNAIAKGLNKKIFQIPIPIFLMRLGAKLLGKSETIDLLLGNMQVDSSNVIEVLGWTPPFTMEQSMTRLGKKCNGDKL